MGTGDVHAAVQSAFESLGPFALFAVFAVSFFQVASPLGLAVPGNPLVLALGLLAGASHETTFLAVYTSYAAGAIAGSVAGHALGQRLESRIDRHPYHFRVKEFMERHGRWAAAFAWFVPFARNLVPMVAGAARVPLARYLVGSAAGAAVWSGVLIGAGYAFGGHPWVERHLGIVVMAIVLVAPAFACLRWAAKRRQTS